MKPEERADQILGAMAPWAPHGPGWEAPEAAIVRHINEAVAAAVPRWVPTGDQLPKVDEVTTLRFAVATPFETIDAARFDPEKRIFEYLDEDFCYRDAEATHWFELPPAPWEVPGNE